MNEPGSTVINEPQEIKPGDILRFNYTNNANLNWTMPIKAKWKLSVYGAGSSSSSSSGGFASGDLNIKKSSLISLKINSSENGGGNAASNARKGSGGTLLHIDSELMIAAGGSGGKGATGTGPYGTSGGAGGNGGQGGGRDGVITVAGHGSPGPTVYDGGGGGGAEGKNYLHQDLSNTQNLSGQNSGNGYAHLILIHYFPRAYDISFYGLERNSVTVSANLSLGDISEALQHGYVWSKNPNPTIELQTKIDLGYSSLDRTFSFDITGLEPNTKYYVRAYATDEDRTNYSEEISFVTHNIPVLNNIDLQEVDSRFIAVKSTLKTKGGVEVFDKGVVASTSPSPTINDLKFRSLDELTNEPDSYSTLLSLQPVTQYYLRPYASNKYGTGYGDEIVVTTTHKPEINNFKISPDDPIRSDITVTANLSEEIGQQVKYRILVNGQPYLDWTNLRTTPYNVSDTIPFSFSVFQLENNSITIEAENEDGLQRSQTIEFYVPFEEPTLDSRSEKDTYFRFAINDRFGDKVRYRTFINDTAHTDWSNWAAPGIEYTVSWDSSRLAIGNNNTFRIEWENEAPTGQIHSHEYTFSGQYRGLIFLGPDNVVFSDDLGNVLEMLDLGEPHMGTTSDVVKVTLQNTLEFPVSNITIYAAPETSTKDSLHLLAWDNPDGELDFKHRIYYNDVLLPEDKLTFYVKAEVGEFDNTYREFEIYGYGMRAKVDAEIEATITSSSTEYVELTSYGSTTGKQIVVMSRFEPAKMNSFSQSPSISFIHDYEYVGLGALYYNGIPLLRPTRPWKRNLSFGGQLGNIPAYHGNMNRYSFGPAPSEKYLLYWHKFTEEDGRTIYISDRHLITDVTWNDLNSGNYVFGKNINLNNKLYSCRLLTGGRMGRDGSLVDTRAGGQLPNEWDRYVMNGADLNTIYFKNAPSPIPSDYPSSGSLSTSQIAFARPHNQAWNWISIYSWCQDRYTEGATLRGMGTARAWKRDGPGRRLYEAGGWRPVLELIS